MLGGAIAHVLYGEREVFIKTLFVLSALLISLSYGMIFPQWTSIRHMQKQLDHTQLTLNTASVYEAAPDFSELASQSDMLSEYQPGKWYGHDNTHKLMDFMLGVLNQGVDLRRFYFKKGGTRTVLVVET